MKKTYQLVKIKWLDAEAKAGWHSETELLNEDTGDLCTTVGYLIRKPTKAVPMYFIGATKSEVEGEMHFNNTIKIPKMWVKEITVIAEDDPTVNESV